MSDNILPNGLLAYTSFSATYVDDHWTVTYDVPSPNTAPHHIKGLMHLETMIY